MADAIFTDLLPNVMAQVIVYASLLIPLTIVTEAALSFLGVGVPPPTPDWGQMIDDAAGYYQYGYWWYLFFPSLALLITTLAFKIFATPHLSVWLWMILVQLLE